MQEHEARNQAHLMQSNVNDKYKRLIIMNNKPIAKHSLLRLKLSIATEIFCVKAL